MSRPGEAEFACEADMLLPLAQASVPLVRRRFSSGQWSALFEVPTGDGVADVCAVRFNPRHAAARADRPAITDWADIRTFAVIQHSGPDIDVADLAAATGLTQAGLKRGPLRRLAEAGHLRWMGSRRVEAEWRYTIPITGVATIEAKLTDWRRALVQARRHVAFADASYIALPPRVAQHAVEAGEMLHFAQVGVLSVTRSGGVELLVEAPTPHRRREWALRRMFAAERMWAIHAAGEVSGPARLLFGKQSPSSVEDPRSAVAAPA